MSVGISAIHWRINSTPSVWTVSSPSSAVDELRLVGGDAVEQDRFVGFSGTMSYKRLPVPRPAATGDLKTRQCAVQTGGDAQIEAGVFGRSCGVMSSDAVDVEPGASMRVYIAGSLRTPR